MKILYQTPIEDKAELLKDKLEAHEIYNEKISKLPDTRYQNTLYSIIVDEEDFELAKSVLSQIDELKKKKRIYPPEEKLWLLYLASFIPVAFLLTFFFDEPNTFLNYSIGYIILGVGLYWNYQNNR
jgi:hypothetical protein